MGERSESDGEDSEYAELEVPPAELCYIEGVENTRTPSFFYRNLLVIMSSMPCLYVE